MGSGLGEGRGGEMVERGRNSTGLGRSSSCSLTPTTSHL